MTSRLSDILTINNEFNFFMSIVELEPFDLTKLQFLINDLLNYLKLVEQIFIKLKDWDPQIKTDFDWVSEGNTKFYDIYRNIDSIDSIVLQALNLLENNLDKDPNILSTDVFDDLNLLSEASLDIKQNFLLPFKTRIDIAVEYNEICNVTMDSINQELELSLKKCFKIHEKRFSSPVRHAPSFNLEILTKKLLQQKSLKLPLLNEVDHNLYQEYLELKTIVDPLKASLNFLPSKIQEFNSKYKGVDDFHASQLNQKYNSLTKELDYLQNEVQDLKYDLVDSRWSEIFSYLNTEISFLISVISKELVKLGNIDNDGALKEQLLKRLQNTTKIVDDTFIIINQAIDQQLLDFKVTEKSNELAGEWLNIKATIPTEILEKLKQDLDASESMKDITKSFKTLTFGDNDETVLNNTALSKKDRRRSKAGQFLMGKMKLVPILVEGEPTSVRKPEDLQSAYPPRYVLNESNRVNESNISPSKLSVIKTEQIFKIPPLKNSLAVELEHDHHSTSSRVPYLANVTNLSSIEESPIAQNRINATEESHHDVFQTPAPKLRYSLHQSEIPQSFNDDQLQSASFEKQSRIPRPVSRVGIHTERPSSRLEYNSSRPSSSVGERIVVRPSTTLAISRNPSASRRPPSRSAANLKRHSMLETPQSSKTFLSLSRNSLLPQPTPIKEIMAIRSASRLEERNAAGLRKLADFPPKPVWK